MTEFGRHDGSDDSDALAASRVGKVLHKKWRLDALLGRGGMASVYAATHRNGRRGAVKVLHTELAANEDLRSRFLREGYVANRVAHPGAVAVLDDDQDEHGTVFLVMELLEGQTLQALAESRPGQRLDLREVASIAERLLDVLAAAHEKGIVHRDVKPENLFLTRAGELKVLDFGIARLLERSGSLATEAGRVFGTPAFMPPEQARGLWHEVDARSDLWAVGAVMFALATGREVHTEARTLNELLLAAMTTPAPTIGSLVEIPVEIGAVIDRALAFDSSERWPDAASMQSALRAAHEAVYGCAIAPSLSAPLARFDKAADVAPDMPPQQRPTTTELQTEPRKGTGSWPWVAAVLLSIALALGLALTRRASGPRVESRQELVPPRLPKPTAIEVPPVPTPPSAPAQVSSGALPSDAPTHEPPSASATRRTQSREKNEPVGQRPKPATGGYVPPALER